MQRLCSFFVSLESTEKRSNHQAAFNLVFYKLNHIFEMHFNKIITFFQDSGMESCDNYWQSLLIFDHNTHFHNRGHITNNRCKAIIMNWIRIQRKTFKQWKLQTIEWRRWGKTEIWKFQPDPYYKEFLNSGNSWKQFWPVQTRNYTTSKNILILNYPSSLAID